MCSDFCIHTFLNLLEPWELVYKDKKFYYGLWFVSHMIYHEILVIQDYFRSYYTDIVQKTITDIFSLLQSTFISTFIF